MIEQYSQITNPFELLFKVMTQIQEQNTEIVKILQNRNEEDYLYRILNDYPAEIKQGDVREVLGKKSSSKLAYDSYRNILLSGQIVEVEGSTRVSKSNFIKYLLQHNPVKKRELIEAYEESFQN